MEKTALVYNPEIRNYHFGSGHPFKGERFEIFVDFIKDNLPNFKDYFEEILPEPAKDKYLRLAHSKEYIEAIEKASGGIILPNILEYASVDNLNPLTSYLPKGIDKPARIIAGTSLLAGELVFEGKFKKAVGIGGGLHHAKMNYGEGFCIYNDVVVCAKNLLNRGLKRILILDTDAHAGNGTAEAFYEDNRVLFIDVHQDPRTIYPGTGFINEIGSGKGEGFTVNIPLPPGAGDLAYQYCFDQIIFPIAKEFKPEIIIRYGGSDPYFNDSLTQLGLTLEGFRMIGEKVKALADEVCQGKEVDLLASGYNQEILPKAWLAILTGLLDLLIDKKLFEEKMNPSPPQAAGYPVANGTSSFGGWNESRRRVSPRKDSGLEETKEIVKQLKQILKKYWKCLVQ